MVLSLSPRTTLLLNLSFCLLSSSSLEGHKGGMLPDLRDSNQYSHHRFVFLSSEKQCHLFCSVTTCFEEKDLHTRGTTQTQPLPNYRQLGDLWVSAIKWLGKQDGVHYEAEHFYDPNLLKVPLPELNVYGLNCLSLASNVREGTKQNSIEYS